MATLKGNSGFKWTPPGGTEQTHTLQYPLLLEARGSVQSRSWTSFGRDYSQQAAVNPDSYWTAYDYRVAIRFDDSPAGLLDVLEDAADGVDLDYYPDLSGSTVFTTWLIEPTSVAELVFEEERGTSEYRTTVTLRSQTADFEEILANTVTY